MKTLGDIGEQALIKRLARRLPSPRGVAVGIGDDCAVVRVPGSAHDLVYTTDAVIEGTHFLKGTAPEKIGHKAVGRVLSDLAAMGSEPLYILINLVATRRTPLACVEEIYRGAARLCARHGAAIIGGDTSTGPVLELHVFGVGRVPRNRAVLRSGARAGDVIYVTGRLGGSIHGKHLTFDPRVREGQWLRNWATAMIDISDGLATDLRHITEASGVGAEILPARIPLAKNAKNLQSALSDGEDFELLFTVSQKKAAAFERAWHKSFRLLCT
ncbi:MAG TPA: thiamine-phosphate kinase, partial [Kiritimatiellia bacterium]